MIKFSIVTVVRNAKECISATIESVYNQTGALINYIIIDGASTDGTIDCIQTAIANCPIETIFISEPDSGIYNAMNKGLKLATGDYVLFLNAGDAFASNHVLEDIESALNGMDKHPAMVYGNYRRVGADETGQIIPARDYHKAWYGMFASHQSMLYSIGFLRENDLRYDESYRIAADYKLTLEVIKRSDNILQLPICISQFDTNGLSCLNQSLGLDEADHARKEVLKMNVCSRKVIILMQLAARFVRNSQQLKCIYNYLRN